MRVSFSSATENANLLLEDPNVGRDGSIASLLAGDDELVPVGRTMNAVKVFFIVVGSDNSAKAWSVPFHPCRDSEMSRFRDLEISRCRDYAKTRLIEPSSRDFMDAPHATPESVSYPRNVVERLERLLIASNGVYPSEKRKWGDMHAGFLERL